MAEERPARVAVLAEEVPAQLREFSGLCFMGGPMSANDAHERTVKPTTHALRRRRESDSAPRNGIDTTTSSEATAFATASIVFDTPRSLTSQTAK